jgi:hypothetical protein
MRKKILWASQHGPVVSRKRTIPNSQRIIFPTGREILAHSGKISAENAKLKADREYEKFKKRAQYALTPVEQHFLESLERVEKKLIAAEKKKPKKN